MASVDDVVAAILEQTGPLDTFKLQKLVYYCQAWHLAWDGVPLFKARIEAWANGPVSPYLYKKHRGSYRVSTWPDGNPSNLTESEHETVNAVLEVYGDKPAGWLSEVTHREAPWREARARAHLKPGERGQVEITQEAMAEYYGGLIGTEEN